MQPSPITEYKVTNEEIRSLVKIQSLWRGYTVRRNYLSSDLYIAALQFIENCPTMKDVPRANAGVTKVFLPDQLPVVFKNLGPVRSKNRFFTMWKARDICLRYNYKHLLIPRAHPTLEYNIEDRFPVTHMTLRQQIALYEENQGSFSNAAKDFTGFLCRFIFPDIVTFDHPYLRGDPVPLVRSDNIPFLIEGNVGKVALIDLGGLRARSHELSLDEALESAKTAIYIFPYHFSEIYEVVSSFCPEIQTRFTILEEVCKKTTIQFKSVYADHKAFIEKHSENLVEEILSSRTIKIDCEALFNSMSEITEAQLFLDELTQRGVIAYANFYLNRAKKQFLIIHY